MDTASGDRALAWIPVSEAALCLKVSRQRVYQLIDEGELMAIKRNGTWLVNFRSVAGRVQLLRQEGG